MANKDERQVQPRALFEERILGRIRESIGELMTDEELKAIIERGVEKVFFEPTEVRSGYSTTTKPALIDGILQELLKDQVFKLVSAYIKENNEEVIEAIEKIIKQGMGKALLDAITWQFQFDLDNFKNSVMNTIQNR